MKLENTLENKARFFALYWGQKIQSYKLTYSWKRNVEVNGSSMGFLTLTPLSLITDEDALELSKIANKIYPNTASVKHGHQVVAYIRADQLLRLGIAGISTLQEMFSYLARNGYYIG